MADPKLTSAAADPKVVNDYRPRPDNPVINAGVKLAGEWPDPLRNQDKGKPDIGALPLKATLWNFGRAATTSTQTNRNRR